VDSSTSHQIRVTKVVIGLDAEKASFNFFVKEDYNMRRILMVLVLCASVASVAALQTSKPVARAWAVAGYYYAKNGGTAEGGLVMSLAEVWHSAVWGIAIGGPAGAAVGAGIGV
jgi:hypothetical protein